MKIAIIGGGIAGLSAAIALRSLKAEIHIYESAPELAPVGAGLVLAANAVKALQRLEVADAALSRGQKLESLRLVDERGTVMQETDNREMEAAFGTVANFSIHRGDLQAVLLEQLEGAAVHTGKRLQSFEQEEDAVHLQFEDGTSASADYVIAADGVHSVVRQTLRPKSAPRYAGYTCWRATIDRWEKVPPHATTEFWGKGRRFGIVPLADDRIYWFATLNAPEPYDPTYQNYSVTDLQNTFRDFHEPVPSLLRRTPEDRLLWNDILDIRPISRFAFGRILLVGDAGHATTPNMGQGACQALEDSATLHRLLEEYDHLGEIFRVFERRRLARTTWIINTSRRLGEVGQWENPVFRRLRDGLMRLLPPAVRQRQLERLFGVEF